MLLVHVILVLMRFKGDQVLLAAALFLSGIGVLAQFRMGSYVLNDPAHVANYVANVRLSGSERSATLTSRVPPRNKQPRQLGLTGLQALEHETGFEPATLTLAT